MNKRMKIEEGKSDILVGEDKDLPKVVKSLIEATAAGELDQQIKTMVEARKKRAPLAWASPSHRLRKPASPRPSARPMN